MRETFQARLQSLCTQKRSGGWKDGWVYGRLTSEFGELQPDELNAIATALGYKYGFNPMVKGIWEEDWKSEKPLYSLLQNKPNSKSTRQPNQSLTDVERALVSTLFQLTPEQQLQLLNALQAWLKQA